MAYKSHGEMLSEGVDNMMNIILGLTEDGLGAIANGAMSLSAGGIGGVGDSMQAFGSYDSTDSGLAAHSPDGAGPAPERTLGGPAVSVNMETDYSSMAQNIANLAVDTSYPLCGLSPSACPTTGAARSSSFELSA